MAIGGREKRKLLRREVNVGVCLVGTYVLTTALLPLLEKEADARVVSLGCCWKVVSYYSFLMICVSISLPMLAMQDYL